MASTTMSSSSYLNYLNDYIHLILNDSDGSLIEHLNESYMDEIETHARFILAQWHSEQELNKQSLLYIENVGYLNRKIALLTNSYRLNKNQSERIENLLLNPETIQLITGIIQSILDSNVRHNDNFLRYLSILFDAFSLMKSSKIMFDKITNQAIKSKYYKEYLNESLSSIIQPRHIFFIGSISQLALSINDSSLNELYSQFLITFYHKTNLTNNLDLHYCTLGVLSQLQISSLINDYTCLSTLTSIFINASSKSAKENTKIFLLPILNLFNSLCIQSKMNACYLNTDQFINILLQYVTNENNSRLHTNACLLLGHIISEKQLIQLRISYKLTMKFMDLLFYYKHGMNNILKSILTLTIHEEIQVIIAQTYQLINLVQLSEQYPIVYEIIWKLSFHSDIVQQLIERHDDFLKQLALLTTIPAACGILQNVQMKNLSRLPSINGVSFDISFISSSKDQDIVQQLEENFTHNGGLQVGTTLNSHCILLCASEESKHDCTCQAAVRQALLECKKVIICIVQKPCRIDDWFSTLIVQDKKHLNIIESDFEKILSEIRKDIQNSHHLPAITKRTRIITPPNRNSEVTFTRSSSPPLSLSPRELPPVVTSLVPMRKIQTWTNREVIEWCEKNNLSAFGKILTLYDGRSLLGLAHVSRMSAPHTIINQLRNDCRKQGLRLSFVEFLRFQTALDELLRLEQVIARKKSMSSLANRYVYKGKPTNKT